MPTYAGPDAGQQADYPQTDPPVAPVASKNNVIFDVKIRQVMNGFVVKVGCWELVFQSADMMLAELARYIKDPAAVEKEYLEKKR